MKRIRLLAVISTLAIGIFLLLQACDELVTETTEITISGFPDASFLVAVDSCCLPCTLQFFDNSDGPRHEYVWAFGDGDSSTAKDPNHGYSSAGRYTVTLLIRDTINGNEDNDIKQNFVEVKDTLPSTTASFSIIPFTGVSTDTFSFVDETVGDIKKWRWDFGDSTTLGTASTMNHVYDSAGTYEVRLSITNDCDSLELVDTLIVN